MSDDIIKDRVDDNELSVFDELFLDKIPKYLVDSKQWNKLILVLKNHKIILMELERRIEELEKEVKK